MVTQCCRKPFQPPHEAICMHRNEIETASCISCLYAYIFNICDGFSHRQLIFHQRNFKMLCKTVHGCRKPTRRKLYACAEMKLKLPAVSLQKFVGYLLSVLATLLYYVVNYVHNAVFLYAPKVVSLDSSSNCY